MLIGRANGIALAATRRGCPRVRIAYCPELPINPNEVSSMTQGCSRRRRTARRRGPSQYYAAIAALALVCAGLALNCGASAEPSHARTPPPLRSWGHGHLSAAQMYTITDVGAPPNGPYFGFVPLPAAFNNSGQIIANALRSGPSLTLSTNTCILYNGGAFIDLTLNTPQTSCQAMSMSSADSTGTIRIAGFGSNAYDGGALIETYGTTSKAANVVIYGTHQPSMLYGVNFYGEAVGTAYYAPLGGFISPAIFVAPAGGDTLVLGQPQCTTQLLHCGTMQQLDNVACPFGGCWIDDSGTILAIDALTKKLMTYSYQRPGSGNDLPLIANSPYGAWDLNDAGQILYQGPTPGVDVYSMPTGTLTQLPQPAGCTASDLSNDSPVSINNRGEVLGFDSCGAGPVVYWTWTAQAGTQNLNDQIPASAPYSLIRPIGVNDNGQILVTLYTQSGAIHWGTLDPPIAATTTPARTPTSGAEHQ